ncbi:Doublesex- and mab-3-related transcription factor 1, partial [Orchesella cincta]
QAAENRVTRAVNGAKHGPQIKKPRNPNCALCQNHGKVVPIKAHKRYCPWKDCTCSKCNLTNYRRKFVASQIAARRAVIQDRERKMMEMRTKQNNVNKVAKVLPKERISFSNKTFEKSPINLSTPRGSFESPSTSGTFTESATSSGNLSSSSSSFGSSEYFHKDGSSKQFVGFPWMKSTPPVYQLPEPLQVPNTMFCRSHETNYPIYRIRQDFGEDYKLAAAKLFEARYGTRAQIEMEERLRFYSAYYHLAPFLNRQY